MNEITPFAGGGNVPAFVRAAAAGNLADFVVGGGYPVVSIKGKVFTKKDGEESSLITNPETGDPAASLEVVILDVGPQLDMKHNNRVFYLKEYEEGSVEKPDCASDNGIEPNADSPHPQAKQCAVCPHNAKGTSKTGKGKRCSSSKRLAIATPDNLGDAMLLRVPGDSLMAFSDYLAWLKKSGIPDTAFVVTKIGFDYSVAHPCLTFKGLGWAANDPTEAKAAEVVGYITGKVVHPAALNAPVEEPFETERPSFAKETPAVESKPVKEAAAAPAKVKPAPVEDDLPTTPRTEVKVEAAPKAKQAPVEEAVTVADDSKGGASFDDLDFDD